VPSALEDRMEETGKWHILIFSFGKDILKIGKNGERFTTP
jgi:hypothetical protein